MHRFYIGKVQHACVNTRAGAVRSKHNFISKQHSPITDTHVNRLPCVYKTAVVRGYGVMHLNNKIVYTYIHKIIVFLRNIILACAVLIINTL